MFLSPIWVLQMIFLFLQIGYGQAFSGLWIYYITMRRSRGNWIIRPRAVSILGVWLRLLARLLSTLSLVSNSVNFRLLTLGARSSQGASSSLILTIWSRKSGIESLVGLIGCYLLMGNWCLYAMCCPLCRSIYLPKDHIQKNISSHSDWISVPFRLPTLNNMSLLKFSRSWFPTGKEKVILISILEESD